jgi:hypothetical protein
MPLLRQRVLNSRILETFSPGVNLFRIFVCKSNNLQRNLNHIRCIIIPSFIKPHTRVGLKKSTTKEIVSPSGTIRSVQITHNALLATISTHKIHELQNKCRQHLSGRHNHHSEVRSWTAIKDHQVLSANLLLRSSG